MEVVACRDQQLQRAAIHSHLHMSSVGRQFMQSANHSEEQRPCEHASSHVLLPPQPHEGEPLMRAHLGCQGQVGLEEGLNGADVLPVVVEQVRLHLVPVIRRPRDDLAAKVVRL